MAGAEADAAADGPRVAGEPALRAFAADWAAGAGAAEAGCVPPPPSPPLPRPGPPGPPSPAFPPGGPSGDGRGSASPGRRGWGRGGCYHDRVKHVQRVVCTLAGHT